MAPENETAAQTITEVLGRHWLSDFTVDAAPSYDCACGQDFGGLDGFIAHQAAAVVEALGLTEERHTYDAYESTKAIANWAQRDLESWTQLDRGDQTYRHVGQRTQTRYVTPWRTETQPEEGQ